MAREPLHIVRDTREQKRKDKLLGWTFERDIFQPKPVVIRGSLTTGDYSILGHEDFCVVERKTLSDLVRCLGVDRDRFERELQRLKSFDAACVIVESPQTMLRAGEYRSQLLPGSAWQSVISLSGTYRIPFFWAEDANDAEKIAFDFLRHYANHFWKKARAIDRRIKTGGTAQ